jgi:hypothetical protein
VAAHSAERKQVMRLLTKMRQLAKGLQSNGHLLATFEMLRQPVTPAQMLARLQPSLAAADQVEANRTALKQSLAARDKSILADQLYLQDVSIALSSNLGSTNPQLATFGVPYDKPRRKRSVEEEAVSVALRLQTRQVRGTMGPKQRAAITAAGKPGLVVVDPSGKPVAGVGRPPVAPGKKPTK